MDKDSTKIEPSTQAPAKVEAGNAPKTKTGKLTLITSAGRREFEVPKGFFASDDATLDLSDEGKVGFPDIASKDQAPRRLKLAEHSNAIPNVLLWIEPEGSSGKYAAIISCATCKEPVRRFTSDLHQAFHCLVCGIRAKRSKVALKRAEKRAETKGA